MASRLHDAETLGTRQNDGVMRPKRHNSAVLRLLRLLFAAAVLLSIAIPATRELHLLTARLLVRIPGEKTVVRVHSGGCSMKLVPGVCFTDAHAEELFTRGAPDPDSFISAFHSVCLRMPGRPLETWQEHAHFDWIVFQLASHIIRQASFGLGDVTRDEMSSDVWDRWADDLLRATYAAQLRAPSNGTLWLCEAALHFVCNHDEEGLAALRIAASRPNWDSRNAAVFSHTTNLLMAEGLPRFDAEVAAYGESSMACRHLAYYAREQLFRVMSDAVIRNDQSFAELAGLLGALQRASLAAEWANSMQALPSISDKSGLLARMDQEHTVDFEDWEGTPHEVRQEARDRALQQSLFERLEPDLARELIEAEPRMRQREAMSSSLALDLPAFFSNRTGMTALLFLGLLVSSLMLELPFRFGAQPFMVAKASLFRLGWPTWVGFALACICSAAAIFSALDSITQPVGLHAVPVDPILTDTQINLLFASALAILLSIACVIGQTGWQERRVFLALIYVFATCYLLANAATAVLRHTVLSRLAEEISRNPQW